MEEERERGEGERGGGEVMFGPQIFRERGRDRETDLRSVTVLFLRRLM